MLVFMRIQTNTLSTPLLMNPAIVRRVDSVPVELLTGNSAALRKRIHDAGADADRLRRHIQAQAERRAARSRGDRPLTVRLYAWPMLVSFESRAVLAALEPEVYMPQRRDHAPLANRLRTLWSNAFVGSGADLILPLPRAVHLNAVMAGDPVSVHRCVFKGASILEGGRPGEFRFSAPKSPGQQAGGPIAAPYLMLAYVASPTEMSDPVAQMRAHDKLAIGQLFAAMMGFNRVTPAVRVFTPEGFFEALDTLQLEQLWRFTEWAEARHLNPQLSVQAELRHEGPRRTVLAQYKAPGEFESSMHAWTFDGDWRSIDTQNAMLATVNARLRHLRAGLAGEPMTTLAPSVGNEACHPRTDRKDFQ